MWLSLSLIGCVDRLGSGDVPRPSELEPTSSTGNEEPIVHTIVVPEQPVSTDVLVAVDPGLGATLADELPALLDVLWGSGSDWRVGIVSTALGDPATAGRLIGAPLDDVPEPVDLGALSDAAPYGGLGALYLALQPGANGSFPSAASVHLLVVTAGDDERPTDLVTRTEWVGFRDTAWPDVRLSMVAPEGATVRAPPDGFVGDVADPLGPALAEVGRLAIGITSEFFLSVAPDPTTLRVSVDDVALGATAWTYDPRRNSITFVDYVPEPGTRIEIVYGAAG